MMLVVMIIEVFDSCVSLLTGMSVSRPCDWLELQHWLDRGSTDAEPVVHICAVGLLESRHWFMVGHPQRSDIVTIVLKATRE
jgi:hypothetical protein